MVWICILLLNACIFIIDRRISTLYKMIDLSIKADLATLNALKAFVDVAARDGEEESKA